MQESLELAFGSGSELIRCSYRVSSELQNHEEEHVYGLDLLIIKLVLTQLCTQWWGESQLVRSNSFGRNNNLPRLPSFGKVVRFNNDGGAGSRQQDFAPHDMQRDYYGGVRRMPSFKKHRYHDAEYISMGDQYTPQASETRYVDLHHNQQQRPTLRSQVSFSKLPVGNPNYLKHVNSAYY
jgi:hypothetical protein